MGYESKVMIYDRWEHITPANQVMHYGEHIATFDLSKMGDEKFYELFDTPIDFKMQDYIYDDERSKTSNIDIYQGVLTDKDMYGDVCKYCSLTKLIEYLEEYIKTQEYYRRLTPLLNMLKGFNEEDWGNLVCVHYGY